MNNKLNKRQALILNEQQKLKLGTPGLQLYAGVSSFETKFRVSSAGSKLDIKTSSF
jgi:hypothetical protein